jgi:hypothetical protein
MDMKTYITILLLFGFPLEWYSRKPLTATVPCSDSLLITIKGEYRKNPDEILPSTSTVVPKAQQPEAMRRMDAMHKPLVEAYPQLVGMDGQWGRNLNAGL